MWALSVKPLEELLSPPIRRETEKFRYVCIMVAQTPRKRLEYNINRIIDGLRPTM